jgi:hypothetical protein
VSVEEIQCEQVDSDDYVARYLGGRLSEAKAERFESHFLGCQRCGLEVTMAADIRSARGVEVFAPAAPTPIRRGSLFTILAAAAAVAMMAIGLRQLMEPPEEPTSQEALRGSSAEPFPVTVTPVRPGQVLLRWPAQVEADVYVVEVFAADGSSVWHVETRETWATVEQDRILVAQPEIRLYATVDALDGLRQTIAQSTRVILAGP